MAAGRKMMSNAVVGAALVALLIMVAASGAAAFSVCGIETEALRSQCRSYCRVGSTDSSPSRECCGAVSATQQASNYRCLCQYKNYLPSDIDSNRAMQIPSKCFSGALTSCGY